jgi:hypothetical protein
MSKTIIFFLGIEDWQLTHQAKYYSALRISRSYRGHVLLLMLCQLLLCLMTMALKPEPEILLDIADPLVYLVPLILLFLPLAITAYFRQRWALLISTTLWTLYYLVVIAPVWSTASLMWNLFCFCIFYRSILVENIRKKNKLSQLALDSSL